MVRSRDLVRRQQGAQPIKHALPTVGVTLSLAAARLALDLDDGVRVQPAPAVEQRATRRGMGPLT